MRTNLSLVLNGSKSNKPYTLYSLLSSYITNQIDEGKDVYLIKKITGHSIEVLNRHYDKSDLRKRRSEATARTYGVSREKSKKVDLSKLDQWEKEKKKKGVVYKEEIYFNTTPNQKSDKKFQMSMRNKVKE